MFHFYLFIKYLLPVYECTFELKIFNPTNKCRDEHQSLRPVAGKLVLHH